MIALLRTLAGALATALVAFAAGCGGGETDDTPYARGPSRACLEATGLRVTTRELDFVATTATAGAFRVLLLGNHVTVSFGETEADAQRTEQAYHRFTGAGIPIEHVLMRDRNAVLVWGAPPSAEHRDAVLACLRS